MKLTHEQKEKIVELTQYMLSDFIANNVSESYFSDCIREDVGIPMVEDEGADSSEVIAYCDAVVSEIISQLGEQLLLDASDMESISLRVKE